MSDILLAAQSAAASWWLVVIIIGCGSVIAGTLAAEHFARKRNPYLDPWRDREPGELPEVES